MPGSGFLQRFFGTSRPTSSESASSTVVLDDAADDATRFAQPPADAQAPVASPAASAARLCSPALDAFITTVRQLPLFSSTAMQVIRSVGDESTNVGDLVRLISTDPGLAAHLLRIVNSPFYGMRIATVGDAVAVMGFAQVRRTVSAAVLKRPLMSYLHDTETARTFWRHEMLCGAIARQIALASGADGEVAFMAGLMHEIGRLAMLIENPQMTDLLLRVADDQHGLGIDREIEHFGFDHAAAGGALLERWGLPLPISQAAWDHGAETVPVDPVSAAVWHANLVAHHWNDAVPDGPPDPPWIGELGLTVAIREELLAELAALEAE